MVDVIQHFYYVYMESTKNIKQLDTAVTNIILPGRNTAFVWNYFHWQINPHSATLMEIRCSRSLEVLLDLLLFKTWSL